MDKRPEIVYHYCPHEAFESIIKNKCLWLSSVKTANDYKELVNILEIATEFFVTKNLNNLTPFLTVQDIESDIHFLSFSTHRDDLGQWLGYGANAKGFMIGFDINVFPENAYSYATNIDDTVEYISDIIFFNKIIYNKSEKLYLLKRYFNDEELKKYMNLDLKLQSASIAALSQEEILYLISLNSIMGELAPIFKDSAFTKEGEWRLLYNPLFEYSAVNLGKNYYKSDLKNSKITISNKKFRTTQNGMTSYFEYPIYEKNNPIKEVIIGPKNNSAGSIIESFLASYGYTSVTVKKSEVPYK